jgi:hypothetical protein
MEKVHWRMGAVTVVAGRSPAKPEYVADKTINGSIRQN